MIYDKLHEDHVVQKGRTINVALCYPNLDKSLNAVEVELVDVRAADSILVSYDMERDGWVIQQASTFDWDPEDAEQDPDWQEVAFIPAWGREKKV